jgi:hypothetical protein
MTERHPDLFKVLIREIGQDGKADIVLGKALRVLPETELLKPISDLLHRGSALGLSGFIRPHRRVYPEWVQRWSRRQPYNYSDNYNCLVCQYLKSRGWKSPLARSYDVRDYEHGRHALPTGWNAIAQPGRRLATTCSVAPSNAPGASAQIVAMGNLRGQEEQAGGSMLEKAKRPGDAIDALQWAESLKKESRKGHLAKINCARRLSKNPSGATKRASGRSRARVAKAASISPICGVEDDLDLQPDGRGSFLHVPYRGLGR